MKWEKIATFSVIFLVAAVAVGVYIAVSGDSGENENGEEERMIEVDGEDLDLNAVFQEFEKKTIVAGNGETYDGVSLSYIINRSGSPDPDQHQYRISASDDYFRNVTWDDMLGGVLVEENTMTAFPLLPGKYRIKDVVSIEPVDTDVLDVNGREFTWEQPFFTLPSNTLMDNESNSYEGVLLSDLVNLTGIGDGGNQYEITASDGYSKVVEWNDMTGGVLTMDERRAIFPHLEKSYWVRDIAAIEVV
jgi:hypothetical protein